LHPALDPQTPEPTGNTVEPDPLLKKTASAGTGIIPPTFCIGGAPTLNIDYNKSNTAADLDKAEVPSVLA